MYTRARKSDRAKFDSGLLSKLVGTIYLFIYFTVWSSFSMPTMPVPGSDAPTSFGSASCLLPARINHFRHLDLEPLRLVRII